MTLCRPFLAALIATGSLGLIAAPAPALIPVFSGPATISDPAPTTGWPEASVAADGTVSVVFAEFDGSHLRLAQRTRVAAGDWGPVTYLSQAGEDISGSGSYVITGSTDGSATASWANYDGSVAYAASRQPADSSWSTTALNEPGELITGGSVAPGPGSSTTIFTTSSFSGNFRLRLRTRTAGSDAIPLTREIDLPDDASYQSPAVRFDAAGNAVAVWVRMPNVGTPEIQSARYDAGESSWSDPVTVASAPVGVGDISIALSPSGDAGLVWSSGYANDVSVATMDGDTGAWNNGGSKLLAGPNAVLARIAADGGGDFVAVWQEFNFADPSQLPYTVITTYDAAGGSWSAPEALGGTNSGAPTITEIPGGDIMLAVFKLSGGQPSLVALHRPSGGDFGEEQILADAGEVAAGSEPGVPSLTADANGNVFGTWTQTGGAIGFAVGDATAPRLDAISVPATATAGDPVSVSVSAFDLWSGIDSTTWSFGDGSEATGTSAQHTFNSAGTYTVRVTSTDASGHSSSAERTIVVSDPPAPGTKEAPPKTLAPVLEARLAGRVVTINATITLKARKRCTGTVASSTAFGGRTYRTTLKLKTVAGKCRAQGTIRLKKTPSLRSKLRITISGKQIKTRALTTKRG